MKDLPTDSQERKDIPLARGCLDYFPAALAEVARLSQAGNDKHNPGEEMHHARGKSSDHADCILRHLLERDTVDTDGFLHEVKVAWRALALLQEALEERGAPMARGARPAPLTKEQLLDLVRTTCQPRYFDVPVGQLEFEFHGADVHRNESGPMFDYGLETGRMVPVVNSIGPEMQECPNDIAQRIAGCDARHIKKEYYGE